jgi:DNA-binding XRE family transcriptional regulator
MILPDSATTCKPSAGIYSAEMVAKYNSVSIAYFIVRDRLSCVVGGNAGCAVFRRSELAERLHLSEGRVMQILRDRRWFQEVKKLEEGADPLLRIKIVALDRVVAFLGVSSKSISFVEGLAGLTSKNFKPIVYRAAVGALQSLIDRKVRYNAKRKSRKGGKIDKTGREQLDRSNHRSTKQIAPLAQQSGTVGMFTLVKDLKDQAQMSQDCLADRIGRSRQTIGRWLKSTIKTRLCQIAPVAIARYMEIRRLDCAAIFNPSTRRTELYKVYEGRTYRLGCNIYRVDEPALNKRALKKTICRRVAKVEAAVNGVFPDACAHRAGDLISQDGGL